MVFFDWILFRNYVLNCIKCYWIYINWKNWIKEKLIVYRLWIEWVKFVWMKCEYIWNQFVIMKYYIELLYEPWVKDVWKVHGLWNCEYGWICLIGYGYLLLVKGECIL